MDEIDNGLQVRNNVVTVRLNTHELERLTQRCDKLHIGKSEMFRMLLGEMEHDTFLLSLSAEEGAWVHTACEDMGIVPSELFRRFLWLSKVLAAVPVVELFGGLRDVADRHGIAFPNGEE